MTNTEKAKVSPQTYDLARKVIAGYRNGDYLPGINSAGTGCVYIGKQEGCKTKRCAVGAMLHHLGMSDDDIEGLPQTRSFRALMDPDVPVDPISTPSVKKFSALLDKCEFSKADKSFWVGMQFAHDEASKIGVDQVVIGLENFIED